MVYQWAPGTRVKNLDPQIAGQYLERLRKKNADVLTPKIVVADAKSPNSPLHKAFIWDVKQAAERYWEVQAGYILRKIVVVTPQEDGEDVLIRAFVSVNENDEPVYTSIVRAMKDSDLRRQVLQEAKESFEELRRKYRDLVEFAKVYEALDDLDV